MTKDFKAKMREAGVSMQDIANELNVAVSTCYAKAAGVRPFTPEEVEKIAKLLGVDFIWVSRQMTECVFDKLNAVSQKTNAIRIGLEGVNNTGVKTQLFLSNEVDNLICVTVGNGIAWVDADAFYQVAMKLYEGGYYAGH